MRLALCLGALTLAAPVAASDLRFGIPIDCTLGETCYIQQFVDADPSPGTRDFQCGTLTYDGHKGTDFALLTLADMETGVDVLASASGIVTGLRDGMPDIVFDAPNAPNIDGRECGNGVVLRHEDGWETQYCHMKSGSVQVAKGDQIERGAILGQVGLSGDTEFPHLHLSVRKNGQVVDPFDTLAPGDCTAPPNSLWDDTPSYVPGGLIYVGFSPGIPAYDAVKDGSAAISTLASDAPGLVLFGYAFGGKKGDMFRITITGPSGEILAQSVELEKNQSQFFRAAGKRLTATRWPAGVYTGTVTLQRGPMALDRKTILMIIE